MTITRIRRIELYAISIFTILVFFLHFQKEYENVVRVWNNIGILEEIKIDDLFDLWRNVFWPLLSIYVGVFSCWLLIHYYAIPKWLVEKNIFKVLPALLMALVMLVVGVYFYLDWSKELKFRYDYNQVQNLKTIIGAKVQLIFRLRYWAELVLSVLLMIASYEVLSQVFYKFSKKLRTTDDARTKIYYETALATWLYFIYKVSKFLFRGSGFDYKSYLYLGYYRNRYWEDTFHLDIIVDLFEAILFVLLHSWAYHLIFMVNQQQQRQIKTWVQLLLTGTTIYCVIEIYTREFYSRYDIEDYFSVFAIFTIFTLATAFARYIYARPKIITDRLTRKLTQNQAELSSLKAQINPHFLFNAMNTLYATAIEERAEQTTKGIHQLSEMMRFMMNENNQDQIDIQSEVQYLRNYIDLQRLRFVESDKFELKVELDDSLCLDTIAPMLLIPFVENAFKHGISLRTHSWIFVKLYCQNERLHFSVFNSIHPKQDQDPEKYSSGIGLVNVKKRLELIYPKTHSLAIHRTEKEFSVVLELNFVSKQPKTDSALAFYKN